MSRLQTRHPRTARGRGGTPRRGAGDDLRKAETGPIAPGFGQPGRGLQYQLVTSLLPMDATANVQWLVSHGYLRALN